MNLLRFALIFPMLSSKHSFFVTRLGSVNLPRALLSEAVQERRAASSRLPSPIEGHEKYKASMQNIWWLTSAEKKTEYPALQYGEPLKVHTAIVGGGLFGLLTAEALSKKEPDMKIAVLESLQIGQGVTSRSTAKVTALHQEKYKVLQRSFGQAISEAFASLNIHGVEKLRELIKEANIQCDYMEKDQIVFADLMEHREAVMEEFESAKAAGLPVKWRNSLDELPFPTYGAACLPEQFQVNPVALLRGIARVIKERANGCMIFENSRVEHFSEGLFAHHRLVLESGAVVLAERVVFATQLPIADRGMHFASIEPSRSYCTAFEIKKEGNQTSGLPGMYINFQHGHATRSLRTACNARVLIVSGASHTQGDNPSGNTESCYLNLQEYSLRNWPKMLSGPISNWSAHDLFPADSLPYIGYLHPATRTLFTATGFAKWGFSQASGASLIIQDLICNPGKEVAIDIPAESFSATRFDPLNSFKGVAKEQVHVAKHFVDFKSHLGMNTRDPLELEPYEGSLVKLNGRVYGAYRDSESKLHFVKPVCTHLGCRLTWNQAETSWDCGCHGSRFDYIGRVICGPACKDLQNMSASLSTGEEFGESKEPSDNEADRA